MLEKMVTDEGGTYLMCDTTLWQLWHPNAEAWSHASEGHTRRLKARMQSRRWLGAMSDASSIGSRAEPLRQEDCSRIDTQSRRCQLRFQGNQRQLYGYGISAKRYCLFTQGGSHVRLVKVSEHGLGLYYRPKEGFDSDCEVACWIKEGWQWLYAVPSDYPAESPAGLTFLL